MSNQTLTSTLVKLKPNSNMRKITETRYAKRFIFFLLTIFYFSHPQHSQSQTYSEYDPNLVNVLAFPGAEGFGRFTTGGRGGQVIKVTNLNDSGPGSLRAALDTKGPRIVVFEVSGTIFLKSNLYLKYPDLTIAGQTAPGDGITIANYAFDIDADNVIIRFMRFRLGDKITSEYDDPLKGNFSRNIIIDHCSLSWGTDETASFYANENFTLQWCIISEGLNISVHDKTEHGYGGIWGGKNASFHHNLIAHFTNRNPRFDTPDIYDNGNSSTVNSYRGTVDFRNNVIYNWRDQASRGGEEGRFNIIDNYYKPGPATQQTAAFLHPLRETSSGVVIYDYGKFFVNGNILENNSTVNQDNWKGVLLQSDADTQRHLDGVKLTNPLSSDVYEVSHTASVAFQRVLDFAGSSQFRDPVDTRVVNETRNGTFTFTGSHGSKKGIIDSQDDVGGWPTLRNGPKPQDTDGDGIPDSFEIANNLNPSKTNDREYNLSPYYTDIEVYINSLVQPIINNQNPGTPAPVQLLLPANSNSVFPNDVSFAWSPISTADSYRLQVSKSSSFSSGNITIDNIKALSHIIPQLDPGSTYYWRVRASNASGTGSYSTVRTFTTGSSTSTPGTTVLLSPSLGSTDVTLTPELKWAKVPGASSYRVQISTNSSFSSIVFDQSNVSSSQLITSKLLENTTYYWRVRASNISGTGSYSQIGSFKTISYSVLPGPTLLTRPAHNTTVHPLSISLEWELNPLAESYILQVSTSSSFSSYVINEKNITKTSYFIENLNSNTTYYWRIRPVNRTGTGSTSTVFTLYTSQFTSPPGKVILKEPVEDSNIFSTTIAFSWEKESTSKSYRLQVSTSSDFSSFVANVPGITNTSYSVSNLKSNTQYFWRIFGNNEAGQSISSEVRKVRSATYSGTPPATKLVSPVNNGTIPSNNITFVWENQPNSDRYTLQVSSRSDFSSYIVNVSSIKGTSYTVAKLDDNKTYYWRVRTGNPAGLGERTLPWTFKTGTAAVLNTEVKLLSPANAATNLPQSTTFNWENLSNASSYGLEISETSTFQSLLVNQAGITGNSLMVNNLPLGKTYFWRVYAVINGEKGNYSQVWSFSTESTQISLPPATNLLTPSNEATNQPISVNFSWNEVPTATSYRIQISTSSSFSTYFVNQGGITSTSFQVNNLAENTTYYWRVRTANEAGNGARSSVWSFKTGSLTLSSSPGPAALVSPANNATNINRPVTFTWRKEPNATSYRIQIATSRNFGSTIIVNQGSISDTTVTISNLNSNTQYFWRIRTPYNGTWGESSTIWNFTTGSGSSLRISENENPKGDKATAGIVNDLTQGSDDGKLVSIEEDGQFIRAFPNPVDQVLHIEIPYTANGLTVIQVSNLVGQEIISERLFDFTGSLEIKMPLEKMPSGTYLLIIRNQRESKVIRLLKK
jgi:hypothetical protein